MAIYRTGQASMDAQGYITGYDTKWREQLTLIRPGATIVFLTQPLQIAVITEVINDTSIRAITTGGAVVARSNYAILIHDSITVDGLAQDVAETLRYYQSKETIIEEAIEFFKDFDLKALQDLVNQIKDAAENTSADRAATEQLKNETVSARDSAKQHMTDAQSAKSAAETAKAGAVTARNEAEEFAKSLNAENLLRKDANLSDLTDVNTAKTNLGVQGVFCTTSTDAGKFNQIASPDGKLSMFVANNGNWGVQSTTGEAKPLAVGRGGTGATSAEGARGNLETFRESRTALGETDLNTLTGAKSGVYYQSGNAAATPGRGYPESSAGTLVVLRNGASGIDGCTQIYYPYNNSNRFYIRKYLAGNPSPWTEWAAYDRPNNSPGFRASIGLGVNDKVQFSQVKAYGTNGVFADGIENTQGATFTTRYYDSANTHKGQGEFRVDANGVVNIINRATKSGDATHFFTFDRAGRFWSPSGITTATSMNWNDGNSIVNRSLFMSGQVNSPANNVVYAGIHVGYSNSYAMQIAARDNGFYGRCLESNSWKDWLKITTAAISDESLKDIKGNLNVDGALDNINRMEFKLFRYLSDSPERSTRRGVIAQQVRLIDREYTTKVGDKLHLDTTPMLLDGLAAIQALTKRDNENKEKISRLQKEIEELKAVVSVLINKQSTLED
ncbi:tail fibers protein [Escherichia phage BEK12B]|nr:tail fibers protein [Escherichia phage BEK7]QGH77149.1 tail fibers protein [Escherichia phage BEK1-23]QGH77471.1 tail fibers protein [Escherichia phage BEK12B]QGH77572.1 tail fibers protein [Escherichia phage BEC3]